MAKFILTFIDSSINKLDDWINERAAEFNPFDYSDKELLILRRKAFCELGLLLNCLNAISEDDCIPKAKAELLKWVNDPRYLHLVMRKPANLNLFCYPLLYAKKIGTPPERTTKIIKNILGSRTLWSKEQYVYRYIDLWYFERSYGYEINKPDIESMLYYSTVVGGIDYISCGIEDVYAYTHYFLYLYNFGIPNEKFPPFPLSTDHSEMITALILRFLCEHNVDLVLELTFVGAILRQIPVQIIMLVIQVTFNELNSFGYIRTADSMYADTEDSPINEKDIWAKCYHPMLVSSLTMRYLRNNWDDIMEKCDLPGMGIDINTKLEDVLKLGQVLRSLNVYELEAAAKRLIALQDSNMRKTGYVNAIFDKACLFIKDQWNGDGYGIYIDEPTNYQSETEFEEKVNSPANKACIELFEYQLKVRQEYA